MLTGATGGLGQALRERLKANCSALRLSDVQAFGAPAPGEEIVLADLADAAAVYAMVKGVDAIIHLGGMSVEGPFGPILQANILGMYHLRGCPQTWRQARRLRKFQPYHRVLPPRPDHHCQPSGPARWPVRSKQGVRRRPVPLLL